MAGYQKIDVELDKLLVNPGNYRFEAVKDQQEAMLTMLKLQNNKIISLARDIAQNGLNPTKRPVAKEVESGKYVVLEGNRRITALKLMTNPDGLPGDYLFKSIFQDLHASYKDSLPKVVECVIFPEDQQDIADRWVLLEHTGQNQGKGTVPWNSVQKQRFESRHKQQELSRSLQVLEFLEKRGVDTSSIEATNLERLLTTPQVRLALGLDFSNKQLTLLEPEADVLQKLNKVVERMNAKGFSVGEIYKVGDRLAWIQDVLGLQPAPAIPLANITPAPLATSNNNATTSAPQAAPTAPSPAPSRDPASAQPTSASAGTSTLAPPPPIPTPPPPAPSVYYTLVSPTKLLPATIPAKIVKIYKELQTVHISGQRAAPHAVGALLRILVEITAQEYLVQKHGFYVDSSNHLRNSADRSRAYDEVRGKLEYIVINCSLPGNIARILRTLTGRQLMTAELNEVMHNTIFTADSAAIKGIWQNYENVFDYLIGEMH